MASDLPLNVSLIRAPMAPGAEKVPEEVKYELGAAPSFGVCGRAETTGMPDASMTEWKASLPLLMLFCTTARMVGSLANCWAQERPVSGEVTSQVVSSTGRPPMPPSCVLMSSTAPSRYLVMVGQGADAGLLIDIADVDRVEAAVSLTRGRAGVVEERGERLLGVLRRRLGGGGLGGRAGGASGEGCDTDEGKTYREQPWGKHLRH